MSKEQTPIEKLIDYIKSRGLTSGEKAVLDRWIEEDRAEREQYAQAKVLEALERDKKFYCDNVTISRLRNTKTNAEWRRLVMNRFFVKQK